jgi:hypothetical protein
MVEASIAYDREFNGLTGFAQLLFLKILPHTDDFGRFEGDPEVVRARVDPLSRRKIPEFEKAMSEISHAGLWIWYRSPDGRKFIQYKRRSFDRINAFLIKRRTKSEYSEYEEGYDLIGGHMDSYAIESKQLEVESEKKEVKSSKQPEEAGEGGAKIQYADNVRMTEAQFTKLTSRLGCEDRARRAIEILDNYKGQTEKNKRRYTDDYRAILNWVVGRLEEEERKHQGGSQNDSKVLAEKAQSLLDREGR